MWIALGGAQTSGFAARNKLKNWICFARFFLRRQNFPVGPELGGGDHLLLWQHPKGGGVERQQEAFDVAAALTHERPRKTRTF